MSDVRKSKRTSEETFATESAPKLDGAGFPIVGVAASAGGLEAFSSFLRAIPSETGMGFVLVSHLDPTHASQLTDILSRTSSMPVTEVQDEPVVEPNHVYVIPPGKNMEVAGGTLRLLPRESSGVQHPADVFFRSLAEDRGHLSIGVVLSGMANDGTQGLQAIKAEGGITFAQDDSAQYESMPRSAIAAGCVDFVLSPQGIAGEIARIGKHPYARPVSDAAVPDESGRSDFDRILGALLGTTGVDFTDYRSSTLSRRIHRRMLLNKVHGLGEYAQFLQSHAGEPEALFQDILISVTAFFRNPESFEHLKTAVFPKLLAGRSRHDPLRVWVLGCSTGEEAYSIAISWSEFAEQQGRNLPAQIYATDLNSVGLDFARAGIYSSNIVQDVSPERLRRFFSETDGGYRVRKPIRDMCVFARQNILRDPPFSRMDLVSCRNLLIYLEPELQKRVVPILHYALKPNGFLFLGGSETVTPFRDLFEVEDSKHRVYTKKAGPMPSLVVFPHAAHPAAMPEVGRMPERWREGRENGPDPQREADRLLLAQYAPAGVIVNGEFDVVQFRGETGAYLAPGPGRASLNILKLAREGMHVPLRRMLQRAKREDRAVREENVTVRSEGGFRRVHLQVVPLKSSGLKERLYLVLFEDAPTTEIEPAPAASEVAAVPVEQEEKDQQITRLTQELDATRDYLQSVIEQQEAANEELQSANEEVQSANEELQSMNEELETSKEEIQSSNEELTTVNEELHNRNQELNQLNNDLNNLLGSVQTAIVIVGQDLRIRRFTPMAEKLLNLIGSDLGRPISDIRPNLSMPDLPNMLVEVMDSVTPRELEIQDGSGRWYSLRLRPYKTIDNKIDGAVLMLVDIDLLKRGQDVLRRQTELLDQTHEPILIHTPEGKIVYWNRGAEEIYGYTKEQAIGRTAHELLSSSLTAREIEEALARDRQWTGELTQVCRDGTRIIVESRMVVVEDADGSSLVMQTNHPVTERKQLEDALRGRADALSQADLRKNEFLAMLAHELRNPLTALHNTVQILQASDTDREASERALAVIGRQVRTMSRMTDDLLDVARVTQGKIRLKIEPTDLGAIAMRAANQYRHLFERRGQRLSTSVPSEPIVVRADPVRLEQIVTNLLDNAAKYSPKGGEAWLTVSREEPGCAPRPTSDWAAIEVRDNGIGIDATMLPRVFDLFAQADQSLAREYGGLGIGLTLARRLVEQLGGTIEARSEGLGRGSTFIVRLPVTEEPAIELPAPEAGAPKAVSRTRVPRRILVVDDNADAADSMSMLLRKAGHEVEEAYGGTHALEIAARMKPEVILLDIGMPGMDGYEVARRLRQNRELDHVLLVALTGYGLSDDRRVSKEAGFHHHLVKPVDLATLNDVLASFPKAK